MKKNKDKQNIKIFQIIMISLVLLYVFITYGNSIVFKNNPETKNINGALEVYFIDVGQADAILIKEKDVNILIDAGNNNDGEKLVKYIKSLGINNFKYVFGTHAHEDHIGGMDDIINNFKIENFYMPDVITTTKTFEDVLDALENNSLKFMTPKINEEFKINEGFLKCLYVGDDESDLNNSSIVLKLTYGNIDFLFMGDATSIVEDNIISKEIESDVIKIGHHGSQYSSKDNFIKKVNPSYAVISVGKNNTYNHPKEKTLNTLNKYNVNILRTDEMGTIIFNSDGNNLSYRNEVTDTNG